MQNWFSETEKQDNNESSGLNALLEVATSLIAGGLTLVLVPLVFVGFTLIRGLLLYVGFVLLHPWLVQVAPNFPPLGFWSAWGIAIILGAMKAIFEVNSGKRGKS